MRAVCSPRICARGGTPARGVSTATKPGVSGLDLVSAVDTGWAAVGATVGLELQGLLSVLLLLLPMLIGVLLWDLLILPRQT